MHIASGYSDCSEAIIEAGGVPVLVEHIKIENQEVSEHVCLQVCVCLRGGLGITVGHFWIFLECFPILTETVTFNEYKYLMLHL